MQHSANEESPQGHQLGPVVSGKLTEGRGVPIIDRAQGGSAYLELRVLQVQGEQNHVAPNLLGSHTNLKVKSPPPFNDLLVQLLLTLAGKW